LRIQALTISLLALSQPLEGEPVRFLPPQPLCKRENGSLTSAAFFGEWLVSHNAMLLDGSVPRQPLLAT